MVNMMRIPSEDMQQEFERVLLKIGFAAEKATTCARIFMENSLDGVASHGWNRFPRFVSEIQGGYVQVDAQPERVNTFGAWEQWDGNLGPGPLNALICTDRTLELAREYGMGSVALKNTNHWMRGGTYARKAAEAGFIFMCWTNTEPNMPSWGAKERRIGNNPLILAVPWQEGPVVLDMAMTQYSYGKLETLSARNEMLPLAGGFDKEGNLSKNPTAILETKLGLPIGYWKGAGLSVLIDLIVTLMSGGLATHQIGEQDVEYNISQLFIAFDISRASDPETINQVVEGIIDDLHQAAPATDDSEILYPGERVLKKRQENIANGISIDPLIWQQILDM